MNPRMKDALLVSTLAALPVGAASVTGNGVDLGHTAPGGQCLAQGEFLIEAPALPTGQLPDTKTITYDVIESVNSDMSSPVTVVAGIIVQTGAGGAGAAAATKRFRPATDAKRYYALKATGVATVSAAASSATMSFVF
ncbi:hypothetical protein DAPPUDRAFT_343453 [Daphnia pulex]|uniref:Uncharacterized protein n=1 Tax=Daphnia pulex TaxID=6669 RepID=E9I6R7_DAPPU|nr:hypothetical protein DAPPUDRAFT_343453 [Daphnia pulex]|eukprot:EFX60313.1 hypothetical protein DAPPUDRAFT_343453 [Daphnia pulex]